MTTTTTTCNTTDCAAEDTGTTLCPGCAAGYAEYLEWRAAEYGDDEYGDDEEGDDEPSGPFDLSDDADALASIGWGTDEDYGYFGGDDW